MSGISRRRFITGLGVATGAAVATGYGLTVWTNGDSSSTGKAVRRLTPPTLKGRSDRTLVVVELGGGNDGLSTVVPIADTTYTSLRPTLGITNAIALDDTVGLHPNLAKLAARYQAGHVAIVEGVGYPDPNLSHFASLAYWWAGTPGESGGTGWLGRYLDGTGGLRRSAGRDRHRARAITGAARQQLVRHVDRRHHGAATRGTRVGSTRPTT